MDSSRCMAHRRRYMDDPCRIGPIWPHALSVGRGTPFPVELGKSTTMNVDESYAMSSSGGCQTTI